MMSEPFWFGGDPATFSDGGDGIQEVECDECQHALEVPTQEEYSHGEVTWYAEWVCPRCGESNSREGWYDPNDDN